MARSRSRSRSVSPSRPTGRMRDSRDLKDSKHRPTHRRRSRSREKRDYHDDDRDKRYSRGDHIKPREGRRITPPRKHRSRSPYQPSHHPHRSKSRSRSRSRHRHRSRDRHDSRTTDKGSKRSLPSASSSSSNSTNTNNQANNVAKNEKTELTESETASEEQEMLKLMGFGNFDTTKGKQVPGNNVSAVHVIHKRKYRQYMNRKGGFNRPLDFVA